MESVWNMYKAKHSPRRKYPGLDDSDWAKKLDDAVFEAMVGARDQWCGTAYSPMQKRDYFTEALEQIELFNYLCSRPRPDKKRPAPTIKSLTRALCSPINYT